MNSCNRLPCAHEVLAVFAHPDDESFGLGAVLGDFTAQGTRLRGLCFTHGEASTLGRTDRNLGEVRREELAAAAQVLGVDHVQLLAYPDNGLAQIPLNELTQRVVDAWALPQPIADRLNAEFSASFGGRGHGHLDIMIEVDRSRQLAAIGCHFTQSADNPVLWRRLELLGDREYLRWLRRSVP